MEFRSPLARVRGLGSAKEGVEHWWAQRLTALALVPLVLWFVISIVGLIGADRAAMVAWVGHPINAVLLVLLLIATFYHAQLGLQVVIEDYVHSHGKKLFALIFVKFLAVLLGSLTVFSVLKLALGG